MTEAKRLGFRSRNPDAMTDAERMQKYRRTLGGRQMHMLMPPDVAAALIYLRKEWGMETNQEAAMAAIRFLALCTRQGLTRLPQSIDD